MRCSIDRSAHPRPLRAIMVAPEDFEDVFPGGQIARLRGRLDERLQLRRDAKGTYNAFPVLPIVSIHVPLPLLLLVNHTAEQRVEQGLHTAVVFSLELPEIVQGLPGPGLRKAHLASNQ